MVFEPLTFYIAHMHIITVASLPTEPPRLHALIIIYPLIPTIVLPAVLLFFLNDLE